MDVGDEVIIGHGKHWGVFHESDLKPLRAALWHQRRGNHWPMSNLLKSAPMAILESRAVGTVLRTSDHGLEIVITMGHSTGRRYWVILDSIGNATKADFRNRDLHVRDPGPMAEPVTMTRQEMLGLMAESEPEPEPEAKPKRRRGRKTIVQVYLDGIRSRA